MRSAEDLLAAARREDSVAALDLAARDAALLAADEAGLEPPFSLFLNVDPETLDAALPELPSNHRTHADRGHGGGADRAAGGDAARADRLRSAGWGIALDDVGADSRSLALMPVLYPDVIKLDLRLLADRDPRDDRARRRPRSGRRPSAGTPPCWPRGSTPRSSSRSHALTGRRSARATCSARPRRCPTPAPPRPPAAAARRGRRPVRADAVGARDELAAADARARELGAQMRPRDPAGRAAAWASTAMVLVSLAATKW